ncbi:hypothetical protein PHJA_001127500 [Phtheirospermum japonicum]|uniref:Uncharacterized protein n=1 Tax=Phtheirospermum japonicum TaxID=374723 RepID=A0A830BQ88_9LAMI|nr:hypothetical protein PHJA_001127500 [Phtheirospermum japonicum]
MKIDDSFKKPGSVPFKWEIRPGVPKTQNPQTPSGDPHFGYGSRQQHQRKQLKPPPAGSYFRPPHFEPRPDSFRSPQHTRSRRFGLSGLAQPDIVSPTGCFPSPLVKTKNAGKRSGGPRSRPEYDYYSDPDIPSPWSVSSRKSTASPSSFSFASSQSSPRPVSDAVWAGFGLF